MVLPYTPAVYAAFLERYHQAHWPFQPAAVVLSAVAAAAVFAGMGRNRFPVGLWLAAGWAWTGTVFYWLELDRLYFLAPAYGAFFCLQAILLGWSSVIGRKERLRLRPGVCGWTGAVLVTLALPGTAAADLASGQPWTALRVPGTAPLPTVLLTLGILLQSEDRPPYALLALPLLWCGIHAVTSWSLGMPADAALAFAGLAGSMLGIAVRLRS